MGFPLMFMVKLLALWGNLIGKSTVGRTRKFYDADKGKVIFQGKTLRSSVSQSLGIHRDIQMISRSIRVIKL